MKLIKPVIMASALSIGSARAINEAFFEGGVLEPRAAWQMGDCYSSSGDLQSNGTFTWQSSSACKNFAETKQANVLALTDGSTCLYGSSLPPDSDKVDSSKCSTPCQGWPSESCGGDGVFLFYTQGQVPVSGGNSGSNNDGDSGSSSSSSIINNNNNNNGGDSSTSAPPAPMTTTAPPPPPASTPVVVSTLVGGTTIIVTNSPEPANAAATISVISSPTPDSGSSGTNKAAVAAGVVVGVVGLAAIAGGAFLFLRSKKQRREAADLHRQNSAAGFASRAEKPPSTYSMSDSRLEPAYMRRMSDGSIADNQDYSRRILKVTNPDDR